MLFLQKNIYFMKNIYLSKYRYFNKMSSAHISLGEDFRRKL